jgi:hypothetical protein
MHCDNYGDSGIAVRFAGSNKTMKLKVNFTLRGQRNRAFPRPNPAWRAAYFVLKYVVTSGPSADDGYLVIDIRQSRRRESGTTIFDPGGGAGGGTVTILKRNERSFAHVEPCREGLAGSGCISASR